MNSKTIKYKNAAIPYLDSGKGETTLLFVHGSFINKEYWAEQINHFKTAFRVIAPDLPHHGESEKNADALTVENLGKALTFFVKELQLKNVILVGHSVGADVILESAVSDPKLFSGFIVVDYFKNLGIPVPADIVDQVLSGLKTDFPATVEGYVRNALITPKTNSTIASRVINNYRNMEPSAGTESIADGFKYYEREKNLAGKLSLKAHLLNVNYSPTNLDALKALKTGYTLTTMTGTCHYPMIENPKDFNREVERLIREIQNEVE